MTTNLTSNRPRATARRATVTGLVMTGLLTAALITTTTLAQADTTAHPPTTATSTVDLSAPPAPRGEPDVGPPGEAATNAPAIAPNGRRAQPADWTVVPNARDERASQWSAVQSRGNGVRIRTRPVDGGVVGHIQQHALFWVHCETRARDGYEWGWSNHAGRLGWVRNDLYYPIQGTAPGSGHRPIPNC